MNFPFGSSGPNLDRFNFLRSRPANPQPQAQQPSPPPPAALGPHPATVETYNPYDFDDDDDDHDDNDDRVPLSPRNPYYNNNNANLNGPEMTERPAADAGGNQSRFARLSSYLRPGGFGGFGGGFRPASSNYSGAGLRGAPTETVIGGPGRYGRPGREVVESPKSPDFRIGAQDLPSTRLHLPNLVRTWTSGSNGPPSRQGPDQAAHPALREPEPAVLANRDSERRRAERRERRHRRDGSGSGSGSRRHRRDGSGRSGSGRSGNGSGSGRERRRRRHAEGGSTETNTSTTRSSSSRSSRRGPPPKHFLFCFPWIKSRRIRSQILKCFVSGVFLASILTVYLSLALTKNIKSSEFTILLILVILAITIFFCHSLIRLCMLVVKRRKGKNGDLESQNHQRAVNGLPEMQPPAVFGGYAVPREPIRVVLARDEEAAGIESQAAKLSPPAYGLWRESVRVDPNRLYWQRNDAATRNTEDVAVSTPAARQNGNETTNVPRPPSYSSDDGVSYVVEARPRSTLPPPHAAGMHPAEVGRVGQPSPW